MIAARDKLAQSAMQRGDFDYVQLALVHHATRNVNDDRPRVGTLHDYDIRAVATGKGCANKVLLLERNAS